MAASSSLAAVPVLFTLLLAVVQSTSGVKLVNLQVNQCAASSQVITLHDISARLLGDKNNTLVVSGGFSVSRNLTAPLGAEMLVRAALVSFGRTVITIPCINNFIGSCTYDDMCKFLDVLSTSPVNVCSSLERFGLSCGCPIPKGDYAFPESKFPLGTTLPSIEGVYGIQIKVFQNGEVVSCYQITFILE